MSSEVKDKVINKCITLLRGMNVTFYVKTDDGKEVIHGAIRVTSTSTSTRKPRTVPNGTFTAIFKDAGVQDMKVGDFMRIDCRGYEPVRIQASLSAFTNYRWGKGTSTTGIGKDYVEIIRHEPWGPK